MYIARYTTEENRWFGEDGMQNVASFKLPSLTNVVSESKG